MFLDFALVSALLVFAHLVRAKVVLLQNLFIPTSILAGFLALLGSELDVLPFSRSDDGTLAMSAYPFQLVVLLFATLFLGHQPRRTSLRRMLSAAGDTFFYNLAAQVGQYALALLVGLFVLIPLFPELNSGFPVMLAAGFVGGHGTATVFGEVLEREGWEDALSIGYTFATAGLLMGIFGGLLLINIATRRGWTRLVQSAHELPESVKRGFLSDDEQTSLGRGTVSPMAIDPLAWHLALVLCAFGAAHMIDHFFRHWVSADHALPLFAVSMLLGAGLQFALEAIGLGKFVDRTIVSRIGSATSDYLIVFGVASIKLSVVVDHALPLLLMSLLGVAYAAGMLWFLGRRVFRNYWFERSIFVYGWSTGIVAVGILLVRIVDPQLRSRTLEDFGLAYIGISPLEIALLVLLPPLVASHLILVPGVVLVVMFVVLIAMSAWTVGWFTQPPDQVRPQDAVDPPSKLRN